MSATPCSSSCFRGGPARLVEAREEVASALAGLRPDERRALLLLAAGYTLAEAASVAGWTYTKIRRCTHEGRGRLRGIRAEEGDES